MTAKLAERARPQAARAKPGHPAAQRAGPMRSIGACGRTKALQKREKRHPQRMPLFACYFIGVSENQTRRVFLMMGTSAPTTMAARMISRRPCRPTKAMMNAKTLVVPIIAAKP